MAQMIHELTIDLLRIPVLPAVRIESETKRAYLLSH